VRSDRLIGDIGGTNARFALVRERGVEFDHLMELRCADFGSSGEAVRHYLSAAGADSVEAACLAVAGPVVGGAVTMTNNHWTVSTTGLQEALGIDAVTVLNDFEAIAWSLPFLGRRDFMAVGDVSFDGLGDDDLRVAVIGPGTGLGVAGLMRRQGVLVPVTGEGGHIGAAPESPLQAEIIEVLRGRFERVSAERLVSGPGVENIYAALGTIRGHGAAETSAARIFELAQSGDDLAGEAVNVFFEMLGQVAGDLALALGAHDGVFVAGGVARRYPSMLDGSGFRRAFEAKGRYCNLMAKIPTLLITHDQPGLVGAAARLHG